MLKKADYNAKISETENKIPSISGLATTSALTAVENKYVMLVISSTKKKKKKKKKKTDYDAKILDIEKKVTNQDHDKYITTKQIKKTTNI